MRLSLTIEYHTYTSKSSLTGQIFKEIGVLLHMSFDLLSSSKVLASISSMVPDLSCVATLLGHRIVGDCCSADASLLDLGFCSIAVFAYNSYNVLHVWPYLPDEYSVLILAEPDLQVVLFLQGVYWFMVDYFNYEGMAAYKELMRSVDLANEPSQWQTLCNQLISSVDIALSLCHMVTKGVSSCVLTLRVLHTAEFQKRGLQHGHILIWLEMQDTEGNMNVEWCNKTQVVMYLFKYVMKGPDWVGSERLLESPPRVGSGQLHSSAADDPNPAPAPSIVTMTDKRRRLPSQKAQAYAWSKKKNT